MLNGEVAGNEGYGIVEFLLRRQAVSAHAVAVPMATAPVLIFPAAHDIHLIGADIELGLPLIFRSEENTSALQSLMRTSYAVFCLITKLLHNTKYTHPYHVDYPKIT